MVDVLYKVQSTKFLVAGHPAVMMKDTYGKDIITKSNQLKQSDDKGSLKKTPFPRFNFYTFKALSDKNRAFWEKNIFPPLKVESTSGDNT